jgi:hypothetical protein
MRRLYLLLLLLPAAAQAQTLDDILSGYYKACGGAEKLAAVQSLILRGRQMWGGAQKRPMTITIKGAKVRFETDIQPGIRFMQAYDGAQGWRVMPWSGSLEPQPMNEDDTKSYARQAEVLRNDLVTYKERGTKLEYGGKDEIEGSDVYKIKATRADGAVITYYLDADSYLIIQRNIKYSEEGIEQEDDMFPSDYKQINGMTLPFTFETKNDGTTTSAMMIEKYEFNPQIDDALFAMPSAPKN